MTLKTSAVSMFAVLLLLSASTAITRAYADNDHGGSSHSEGASGDDGDHNSSNHNEGVDDNDSDGDDAGNGRLGNKVSGKGCFVKRSDGVKVPC